MFLSDVNECEDATKNTCEQGCINTRGSFKCFCRRGFKRHPEIPTKCLGKYPYCTLGICTTNGEPGESPVFEPTLNGVLFEIHFVLCFRSRYKFASISRKSFVSDHLRMCRRETVPIQLL